MIIKDEGVKEKFVLIIFKNLSMQMESFSISLEEIENITHVDGLTLLKGTLLEIFLNLKNNN